MTSRDRVKALLAREIPDRMGIYEHFWGETLPGWVSQGYPENTDPGELFDYDLVGCGQWFDTSPFLGRSELIEETDEWRVTRDGRGATLKFWKNKSGTPEHIGFEIDTPEKWKEYREPLLSFDRARIRDIEATRDALAKARERGKFSVFANVFVFELLRGTLGDTNFLPALLTDKDWIHDFCQVYLDHFRTHYEVIFREAGLPDGFFLYEDFGFRNRLFCSPKTMAEMIMPYEKQLVSFFKDYGLPVILHSCGDARQAVPLIIDAGFDCLQPMEAKAGNSVIEFAETYGSQLAYMGNINVVPLCTNDRAQVEAEVVPKVRRMKELRIPYLFHSDHSIPPDINYDTYRYAVELFRENSTY